MLQYAEDLDSYTVQVAKTSHIPHPTFLGCFQLLGGYTMGLGMDQAKFGIKQATLQIWTLMSSRKLQTLLQTKWWVLEY